MAETFDISELESLYTERAIVNEATKRETVYKGEYIGALAKVDLKVASEKSPFPGRRMLNLRVTVPFQGKSVSLWQEVSFEPRRVLVLAGERMVVKPGDTDYDLSLPLDRPSKLWGQLEASFNANGRLTVSDVIRALPGSAINVFVLEAFTNDNNEMVWPTSNPRTDMPGYEAERKAFLSKGYTSKNMISSFKAAK